LFPSPSILLIFQAFLYAAGAIPVYRLAHRRLAHNGVTLALVAVYLLYPALQAAVLFDFHGDTLAVAFLMFAIEAADRHSWRSYTIWIALALSCKVAVAAPVAALGFVLWVTGERRAGMLTMLAAVGWGFIAFFLIRKLFAPAEAALVKATASSYISFYFGQIATIGETMLARLLNVLVIIFPALWLAWRAPLWLIPAAIIIVPVAISSGPGPAYDYRYHHYALAVPFLVSAIIYGAIALQTKANKKPVDKQPRLWHLPVALTLLFTIIWSSFFVNTPLNPSFFQPPAGADIGTNNTSYGITQRDQLKDDWLEKNIPPSAAVAADNFIGAHLVNRPLLYLTDYPRQVKSLKELLPEVDYVVTDALFDYALGSSGTILAGGIANQSENIRLLLEEPEFNIITAQDGLHLFGRAPTGLQQTLTVEPISETPALLAQFGDAIGLVSAEIRPQGQNRFLILYEWVSLRDLSGQDPLVAVSRLDGIMQARVAHLPTMSLHDTTEWLPNQIVHEELEFVLPDDVPSGRYPLLTGWYDSGNLYAEETNSTSRVGQEVTIGVIEVPARGQSFLDTEVEKLIRPE
jgi:uncharacterized membrane protein